MTLHTRQKTWMLAVLTLACPALLAQSTPPAADVPGGEPGVVKGENVYVRSGFSTNYYPVAKLNTGDRVTIAGSEFGWLKIVPPAGCFSLVDKEFVDRVDERTGVLNDTAWVYAGSDIDNRRYARQIKLGKGSRVEILGETADGAVLKIVPPPGAFVWINGDFVTRGPGAAQPAGSGKVEPIKAGELKLAQKPATRPAVAAVTTRPSLRAAQERELAALDELQATVSAIEAEIKAEMAKPPSERSFGGILAKLRPLAAQEEDEVARLYAESRIKQIDAQSELISAVEEIRELTRRAITDADREAAARAQIRSDNVFRTDDIAVRGEIRVSGIYSGLERRPKRWRVVDPSNDRTLAYIEVPEGSPIDPVQYYGKFVAIRASARELLHGTVPPVPIYTVSEITVQDPATAAMPGRTMEASGQPQLVPPASETPTVVPSEAPSTRPE